MENLRISCVPVGYAIQFTVIMRVCVWVHVLNTSTKDKKKKREKNQKHYNHRKFFVFSPTDSGSAVLFYLDTVTGRCCSCINYELYSQRPYWSEPPTGNNEIT